MQPDFDIDKYNARLNDLFCRFQSVQKVGFKSDSYKPGLDGMRRFSSILGDPWKSYPCIHVAGTNGKGSVCSMLASALAAVPAVEEHADGQCADRAPLVGRGRALCPARTACGEDGSSCRVGLYTSPHLLDFRERMKVITDSGFEMISREEVWEFLNEYEADFEGLSFFEITTGMAFWWFAKQKVDIAVIEAGLGGRLDSTNIITPILSVVTSIGLDHCAILGSTRAAIAREKAGIFKAGVPAIVGVRDDETAPMFESIATAAGAPLVFASDVPMFDGEGNLLSQMDLVGPYQDINLHTVLTALEILGAAVKEGIPASAARTGLWGRWQKICEKPETICDIGHNPPALKENFRKLDTFQANGRDIIIIYGIMADKDLTGIAPMMPSGATYILAAPDSPRSMPAAELSDRLAELRPDLNCRTAESVASAVKQALDLAQDLREPLIYIGGSTFVVAEALPLFNKTTAL